MDPLAPFLPQSGNRVKNKGGCLSGHAGVRPLHSASTKKKMLIVTIHYAPLLYGFVSRFVLRVGLVFLMCPHWTSWPLLTHRDALSGLVPTPQSWKPLHDPPENPDLETPDVAPHFNQAASAAAPVLSSARCGEASVSVPKARSPNSEVPWRHKGAGATYPAFEVLLGSK